MRKPDIDLTECIICGICVDYCPAVFKLNDAGFVEIVELEQYSEEDIDEVIKNCPADCIHWILT